MRINNTQYVTQTKRILEWFTGANPFIWVSRGMYLALGNMVNHKFYEVAAADYVRLKLADTYLSPSPSKFDNKSVEGTIRNSEPLYFQSAKTNWGSINTWAIMDARGVVWWSGEFTNAFSVSANQTVIIPVGQIKFTLESALDESICIHVHSTEAAVSVTCPNSTYIFGSGTDWYITVYDLATYNIVVTTATQTRTISVTVSEVQDYEVTVDWSRLLIGGRIFYDNGDNGAIYTFYDSSGNELTDQSIAGLATAASYTILGTVTIPRFYITDIVQTPNLIFGHGELHLGTTEDFGTGKSNTLLALSQSVTWESQSIFTQITSMNQNNYNGCNDWFAPSTSELGALKSSGTMPSSWWTQDNYTLTSTDYYNSSTSYVYIWHGRSSTWMIEKKNEGQNKNIIVFMRSI